MNYDMMTLGRFPARITNNKIPLSSSAYRVLFTKGDELLTAPQYRSTFDLSLERAIGGSAVSEDALARAFAVSATAYACTEYSANVIGNIPFVVTDESNNELDNTPLNHFQKNSAVLITDIIRSLYLWGRCYLRKRYNASGWPTGLEWLNPLTVREVKAGDNQIIAYDIELPSRRRERVPVADIVYMQHFDTDPFGLGISKFEAAWRVIMVEQSIATYAAAFFVNSAQPDGFLSFDTPLSDTQLTEARNEWQKNFKGLQHAHRTAVMPGGAKWTPMQAVPKDLAMAELKGSQREDICAVFGVDPMLIGLKGVADPLSANSTYNTTEVAFIRRVALPLLNALILPVLNKQWATKAFNQVYIIAVDVRNIESLGDSYLIKSETGLALSSGNMLDYNESRDLIGYDERADYYKRNTVEALTNWTSGTITLGKYHELVGTPGINPNDPNLNVINIGGQLLPYTQLLSVALKNVEKLAPVAALTPTITGSAAVETFVSKAEPLPQLPAGDTQPALMLPEQRGGLPLQVAISFANNQFLRYARRILSDALLTQKINVEEWITERNWKLDLLTVPDWTPNAVSLFLRTVDYADTRKLDLKANGYVYHDNAIYLSVEGDLSGFQKALAINTHSSGLNAQTSGLNAIRLATVNSKPEVLPASEWPLVADNITVYVGVTEYHQWHLRGVSTAQSKELSAWRKAIHNKGKDYIFKTEALAGQPLARFVQDALSIEVGSGEQVEWLAMIFDSADKLLKADTVRSYTETRAEFFKAMLGYIADAQANEINRQNFAGRVRTLLRRSGLMAFRDGMNDAGYDPESFSTDELATFRKWQVEQSAYVTGFGAEIFKQGISETEIVIRARMWSDISLQSIYLQGYNAGKPQQRFIWKLGKVITEHCGDCEILANQVHPLTDWISRNLTPRSLKTECMYGCMCSLEPTDEPMRGSYLN